MGKAVDQEVVQADGREIIITHPGKLLFPQAGPRVNLEHVPAKLRPGQDALDPDAGPREKKSSRA